MAESLRKPHEAALQRQRTKVDGKGNEHKANLGGVAGIQKLAHYLVVLVVRMLVRRGRVEVGREDRQIFVGRCLLHTHVLFEVLERLLRGA